MSDSLVERRLVEAFADARASVDPNPDLFARVARTLGDARERRRFRLRIAAGSAIFVIANTTLALALSHFDNGRFIMPWWVIELITNIVLVALAVALGPFIKRFGRSYAADVFRANPRTGKSYLVLTDVAYYLIFSAFILFTVTFEEPAAWKRSVGAQLKHEVARVGGILLIMGILHAANVVALPVIGRLLGSGRQSEDPAATRPRPTATGATPASVPPLGPGTWILRIEAGPEAEGSPPSEEDLSG